MLVDPIQKPYQPGGVFITGTDTDIGKTYVSCLIARALNRTGFDVAPRKPVSSGCIRQADNTLLSTDALQLQQASQSNEPIETIGRYCFEPAISPARAIQQANQTIELHELIDACQTSPNQFALIEGAGGFLSPLCSNGLNADLAVKLGYPIILVVGNRLGCLNHTLLTIEAIEKRGLQLKAVILNNLQADSDPDNLSDLTQLIHYPVFHLEWIKENAEASLPKQFIHELLHSYYNPI